MSEETIGAIISLELVAREKEFSVIVDQRAFRSRFVILELTLIEIDVTMSFMTDEQIFVWRQTNSWSSIFPIVATSNLIADLLMFSPTLLELTDLF